MRKQFPNRIDRDPEASAGHPRREQRIERQDQLEQQAEEMSNQHDGAAIDPQALEEDAEILHDYDFTEVSNKQPGFYYMWVSIEYPSSARGIHVLQMQAEGWQVVNGNLPESSEHRTPDGTRKIGDSILMRIPEARKRRLEERDEEINRRRDEGNVEKLREGAERIGSRLIDLSQMTPEQRSHLERKSKQEFGAKAAMEKLGKNLKQGTVPGMRVR